MSGFKTVPFCKDLDKNLSRFRVGDVVVWNRCGGHSFEVFGVCLSGMKELECDWGMGAEKKGTRFIDIYFIYASQGSVSCSDGVVQERGTVSEDEVQHYQDWKKREVKCRLL